VDGNDGALRIDARDGYQYRLLPKDNSVERLPDAPKPPAPTLLQSLSTRTWKFPGPLIGTKSGQPMKIGNDFITGRSEQIGAEYQTVLERKTASGELIWSTREENWFGKPDSDHPSKRINFATQDKQCIYLVAEDRDEHDDLYLAALNLDDGSVVWSQIFW